MRALFYILKDREPVPVPDVLTWAKWFEQNGQVLRDEAGDKLVSTVFLGVHTGWPWDGPKFETAAFAGGKKVGEARAKTWAEAERNHAELKMLVGL